MNFRQTTKSLLFAIAALGAMTVQNASASSMTYNFSVVENNSALDFSNQLRVVVADATGGASFTFFNDVGVKSSIAAIYFDDLSPRMFIDPIAISGQSTGVKFQNTASPNNLPGGENINFVADDANSVDGNVKNGVNAQGEWISFLGLWAGSNTSFTNLISAMDSGAFRVGVHLRALPDGKSETYVTPSSVVPLPAAAWLFGSALLGFMTVSNRRKV